MTGKFLSDKPAWDFATSVGGKELKSGLEGN